MALTECWRPCAPWLVAFAETKDTTKDVLRAAETMGCSLSTPPCLYLTLAPALCACFASPGGLACPACACQLLASLSHVIPT